MKVGWVLGWAVPADWFAAQATRAWPHAEHVCVPAASDWRERLEALGELDCVGGYSLGSLLLLEEREHVSARWGRVGLIAPIWAFPREAERGGRIASTQVKALARWMRLNPAAARADFYERAGLGAVAGEVESAATLEWGLARLEKHVAPAGLPAGWFAAVGSEDRLLDAARLVRCERDVRLVSDAGHAPHELIAAWAKWEGAA